MGHRIQDYNYFEAHADDFGGDIFYEAICDGLLQEKYDVRFIVGQLWKFHDEGKCPIVAIFLPKDGECEMERKVDQGTGEIIEEAPPIRPLEEPNVAKALTIIEPSTDVVVQQCLNQVAEIEKWANAFTVTSLADEKKATNDISVIIKVLNEAEKRRKEITDPSRLYVEHVNAFFKQAITGPLGRAKDMYGSKVVAFTRKQKEQADRVAKENRFKVEQALAEANAKNKPVELPALESQVFPTKTVRAEIASGSIRTKRKWRFKEGLSETEIMEKLPDRWKCPDTKKMDREVEKNLMLSAGDFGEVVEFYPEDRYQTLGRKVS